jgi:hypothetical protein
MRNSRLSISGILALVVLLVLLGLAIRYAVHVWLTLSDVQMSTTGWVFLVMGAVVTILVGVGLMTLTFYSNRHDYDR